MSALIHWPEWAKLARECGRTRAKADREARRPGTFGRLVAMMDPGAPPPPSLMYRRLANTMREIAQNTRRGTEDRVRVVEVANG